MTFLLIYEKTGGDLGHIDEILHLSLVEPSHTPQHKIGYCQQCPGRVQWPAHMGPSPGPYFNAGMFVFEPGLSKSLLQLLLLSRRKTSGLVSRFFESQDFLNLYFRDSFKPLPPAYNLIMAMLWRHPDKIELENVKVVHYYAAGAKPWRFTGKEENMDREDVKMLVKKWWDIYNDKTLDRNSHARSTRIGPCTEPVLDGQAIRGWHRWLPP